MHWQRRMKIIKNILFYSGLILLVAFLIVLVSLGIYKLSISAWQLTTFTRTAAVIITCEAKWSCSSNHNRTSDTCGFSYYPVARIENGNMITGSTGTPEYQCAKLINKSVGFLVNPKNKSEGVIYNVVQFWLLPLFILLFLFMVGLIAITVLQNFIMHNKALHQTNRK